MPLTNKRVAILLENLYEENEFWYPYYRMKEEGAEVIVVAPATDVVYRGKHGLPARADQTVDRVAATDFDAVIIPGGYSPDHMRRNEKTVSLVREACRRGKVVAAICHGPWMLASAGALENRSATSFFSIKDDIRNAGAEWVDEEVVRDGNLVTSRMPADLPAFCRTIIAALSESQAG